MKKLIAILLAIATPVYAGTMTVSFNPPPSSIPAKQNCDAGGFTGSNAPGCNLSLTTAGNLVVAGLFVQGSTITVTSVTDGAGGNTWHVIGPIAGTNNESFIAWTVVVNAFSSWSFNLGSSTSGDASALEYANMAPVASVFDCASAGSSGNSASLTSGSCTPTAQNDLLVGVGGVMQNSSSMTAGAGYTLVINNAHGSQGNSYGLENGNGSSCSAQTATMTTGTSGQWSMIMAAFKTNSPTSCSGSNGGGSVTFF